MKRRIGFVPAIRSSKFQQGDKEHSGTPDDLANLSLSQKVMQILLEEIDKIWYLLDLYEHAKKQDVDK